jgi:hypothetical protein
MSMTDLPEDEMELSLHIYDEEEVTSEIKERMSKNYSSPEDKTDDPPEEQVNNIFLSQDMATEWRSEPEAQSGRHDVQNIRLI